MTKHGNLAAHGSFVLLCSFAFLLFNLAHTHAATSTTDVDASIGPDALPPISVVSTYPSAPNGGSGWFTTVPMVTLQSSEPGTTQYRWDRLGPNDYSSSNDWQTYVSPFLAGWFPSNGRNTLFYRSIDLNGNTEDVKSMDFKIDTIAPIVDPADVHPSVEPGEWFSAGGIDIMLNYPDLPGVFSQGSGWAYSSFLMSKDSSELPDATSDSLKNPCCQRNYFLLNPPSDGAWYFHFRSWDIAGNESTSHYGPFRRDATPPTWTYGKGVIANGSYVRKRISFPVVATDNLSGMRIVRVTPPGARDFTWPFAPSVDTRKLPNGKRTFTVMAVDKAGASTELKRFYRIDNYRPITSAPKIVLSRKNELAHLYFRATDPFSNRVRITIKIKTRNGRTLKTLRSQWRKPGRFDSLPYRVKLKKGNYKFYVYATDRAGNTQAEPDWNWLQIR